MVVCVAGVEIVQSCGDQLLRCNFQNISVHLNGILTIGVAMCVRTFGCVYACMCVWVGTYVYECVCTLVLFFISMFSHFCIICFRLVAYK